MNPSEAKQNAQDKESAIEATYTLVDWLIDHPSSKTLYPLQQNLDMLNDLRSEIIHTTPGDRTDDS